MARNRAGTVSKAAALRKWAEWCEQDSKTNPDLVSLHELWADKNVEAAKDATGYFRAYYHDEFFKDNPDFAIAPNEIAALKSQLKLEADQKNPMFFGTSPERILNQIELRLGATQSKDKLVALQTELESIRKLGENPVFSPDMVAEMVKLQEEKINREKEKHPDARYNLLFAKLAEMSDKWPAILAANPVA